MKKTEETYPNFSIYILDGATLKLPFGTKRVKIYGEEEAEKAAINLYNRYNGKLTIAVLRYVGPHDARFYRCINGLY